jgi:hypothetical protein
MIQAPLLLLLILCATVSSVKRSKWDRLDWSAVDRELEEGDEKDLLVTEDAIKIADMERRRGHASEPPATGAELPCVARAAFSWVPAATSPSPSRRLRRANPFEWWSPFNL